MVRAVSVRLDEEAQRALSSLEAVGMSQSQAIRKSLVDSAAALHRRGAVARERAELEADEEDRREMLDVAALMESLRAEG